LGPALLDQVPILSINSARIGRPLASPYTGYSVPFGVNPRHVPQVESGKNLKKMRTKVRLVVGLVPYTLGMRKSTRRSVSLDSAPYYRGDPGITLGPPSLVILSLHRCM
jgi:hypothetical protein